MSEPTVIKLDYPVDAGSETIDELRLTRPKVKHLKQMDEIEGDVAKAEMMISVLSGVPLSVISNMDAVDFAKAGEVLDGFLGSALPIGGK